MSLRPSFALPLIAVLALAGCGSMQGMFSRSPQAANEQQTASTGQESQSVPVPATQFTDIPVPTNSRLELGRTLILGARDDWTGRAFFETPYSVSDLFDFYKREMPNFAWTEISSARSESSVIVYSRVSRIATIHIVGKSLFSAGATVNILVAPSSTLGGAPGGPMPASSPSSMSAPQPVPPPVGMAVPGGPAPVRTQPLR